MLALYPAAGVSMLPWTATIEQGRAAAFPPVIARVETWSILNHDRATTGRASSGACDVTKTACGNRVSNRFHTVMTPCSCPAQNICASGRHATLWTRPKGAIWKSRHRCDPTSQQMSRSCTGAPPPADPASSVAGGSLGGRGE